MKTPSEVINFQKIINPVKEELDGLGKEVSKIAMDIKNDRKEINDILQRVEKLAGNMKIPIETIHSLEEQCELLNQKTDEFLSGQKDFINKKYDKFPQISTQDIIFCSFTGVLSILIDVVFVGTPEVVKIYKAGENFDGSIITAALRKIGKDGSGNLSTILEWFSDKCKVPYDISLKSGVITPDNHRLRSFAHDPFFGLFFAIADIILGTTTCIDNNGKLTILINKNKAPTLKKWLAVIYYIGHIVSDMCTARGIAIPGFFMTQFFIVGISDSSIEEIVESMYKDGYDLRHLASMSVPVVVKDILLNLYLKLTCEPANAIMNIAEREKYELDFKLKTYKMAFIANSIATVGNVAKFVAPLNCGNPCALNLVQWIAFIQNSITMIIGSTRDFSGEEAMYNRKGLDKRWEDLLVFPK